MKYLLLPVFFLAFALSCQNTFAQQNSGAAAGNMVQNNALVAGNFNIDRQNAARGITEHINVNYVLSPAPFNNVLNLQLNTADPLLFTADIVDNKNKVLF